VIHLDLLAQYGLRLLTGLGITLELTVVSVALGGVLAFALTWMRLSRYAPLRLIAFCYSYTLRGTPLLAQVFLVYYGSGEFHPQLQAIGLWPFFREPQFCALLTFTLNTAAYQSEIYRGAVLAIPRGQIEAALAIAMRPFLMLRHVIVPQAARYALRPLGNEIVLVLKGSSVASVITVFDLLGQTRFAFQRSYDFQIYFVAAVTYIVIVEIIRRLWRWLDHRLNRHVQRPA